MKHRVCYRGSDRHGGKFTHAFGADRARLGIELPAEQDIKGWDVRIAGNEISGHVPAHVTREHGVHLRLLQKSLAGSPDYAADRLTAGGLWIDDAAYVVGSDHAIEPNQAEIWIDT